MQRNAEGRVYYVDHKNKTTSWTPPPPEFVYSLLNSATQWVRGFDGSGVDQGQRWLQMGALKPPRHHLNPNTEHGQIEMCVRESLAMNVDWQRRADASHKIWYIRGDDIEAVTKYSGKTIEQIQKLPFKDKCVWFRQQMERLRVPWNEGHADLKLRREHFTSDSFNIVEKLDQRGLRSNFRFEIAKETKLSDDAGGVTREWFQIMTREVFDADKGLFKFGASEDLKYQINELSWLLNERHKNWFHFTGRMMGKALFDGMALSAHLTRALYKHLIRQPITIEDFEFLDPQEYNSLKYMKENSIENILFETFSVTQDRFGEKVDVDLCPGGSKKDVTDENKEEYINLKIQYIAYESKKEQIERFLQGFWEVVPTDLMQVFDPEELEKVMCGVPEIDMKDWQDHTFYQGELAPSHPCVKWFWALLESMDDKERAMVLQFITASSVVPVEGFKGLQGSRGDPQPFTIENTVYNGDGTSLQLPKAHTCFNKLDLPLYPTEECMIKSIRTAIDVESEGFYHE